jgi:hypothetical protein
MRAVMNGLIYISSAPGANGAIFQKTFRRAARSMRHFKWRSPAMSPGSPYAPATYDENAAGRKPFLLLRSTLAGAGSSNSNPVCTVSIFIRNLYFLHRCFVWLGPYVEKDRQNDESRPSTAWNLLALMRCEAAPRMRPCIVNFPGDEKAPHEATGGDRQGDWRGQVS